MPIRYNEKHADPRCWPILYEINENGCWVCVSGSYRGGYRQIKRNGGPIRVHRYIYELEHGEIPDGHVVMHKCDNPPCINPDHLTIGTNMDNMRDKIEKNRHTQGMDTPNRKLNAEQVLAIYNDPRKNRIIAAEYGVSKNSIQFIKSGRTWRSVTGR